MRKSLFKQIPLIFLSGFMMLFSSCNSNNHTDSGNQDSHSATEVSESANVSTYDSDNFVESNKEVTSTTLVTYDGPNLLESSSKCQVSVNGNDLFVYETRVNHNRKFTYEYSQDTTACVVFDFEGLVHVEINVLEDVEITSAIVRPLVYGITPSIEGKKISFDLQYNGNYIVEYNDDSNTAIHVFANPLEENPITKEDAEKDSSIVYIGPGIYNAGAIPAYSNSTIYLAGGAYVYGQIRAEGVENLTIRGRGIISGSIYDRQSESQFTLPVELRKSKNIKIEDICFFDPAGWTITLYKLENVTINNIKIITARANGDGISVQSCKDVTVNGGYVRTWDDSLVVKNSDRGTTSNVKFNGVTVWTDLAQSMEVGYETYGATMDEITFENITVVHNFHKPAMSIHNCDDAEITNVTYKNITLEDGQMLGDNREDGENDFFIEMTIAYNIDWTKSEGNRGSIDGVTIDNVKVYSLSETCVSRFNGESTTSMIKNINISDIEIAGNRIKDSNDLKILTNSYTSNINVSSSSKKITGAVITLPYKLNITNENVNLTTIPSPEQKGLLVPSFSLGTGELSYVGVPNSGAFTVECTHSAGNKTSTKADDGSGDFTYPNYSSSAIVDKDSSTLWKSKDWQNIDEEFAALTIEFDSLKTVGVVRILGNLDNQFYYTYQISVWGRKIKTDGTVNDNYTRLLSSKSYEMTPAKNNCIDINITTQQYAGIQLRLYRTDSFSSCNNFEISEVEFYPPSLTFNKAVVESSEHADVYNVEKLVDGDVSGTSYYESSTLPATIVIDMGDVYNISCVVLSLPPSLLWEPRTQNIEIYTSSSTNSYDKSTEFTQLVAAKDYLFDPAVGNRIMINVSPTAARFIKIIINSNDTAGGYGAQLSEISVYGE